MAELKLGGRTFKITRPKHCTDAGGEWDTAEGAFFERRGEIQVKADLGGEVAAQTLCHEILHAMIHMSPLEMDEAREEEIANSLEPWLHALLSQNPELVTKIGKGRAIE